jgi:hypothetical protein
MCDSGAPRHSLNSCLSDGLPSLYRYLSVLRKVASRIISSIFGHVRHRKLSRSARTSKLPLAQQMQVQVLVREDPIPSFLLAVSEGRGVESWYFFCTVLHETSWKEQKAMHAVLFLIKCLQCTSAGLWDFFVLFLFNVLYLLLPHPPPPLFLPFHTKGHSSKTVFHPPTTRTRPTLPDIVADPSTRSHLKEISREKS